MPPTALLLLLLLCSSSSAWLQQQKHHRLYAWSGRDFDWDVGSTERHKAHGCAAGRHAVTGRSDTAASAKPWLRCTVCPSGRFKPLPGDTARCKPCPRGRSSAGTGGRACLGAPASAPTPPPLPPAEADVARRPRSRASREARLRALRARAADVVDQPRTGAEQPQQGKDETEAEAPWLAVAPVAPKACGVGWAVNVGVAPLRWSKGAGDYAARCEQCPAGKHQPVDDDVTMSAACKPCPPGKWTRGVGAAACLGLATEAGAGSSGVGFDAHGGFCPPGKWGPQGILTVGGCQVCAPGRYGAGGSADGHCDGACGIGRYGLGGSASAACTGGCARGRLCPEGSISAQGARDPCPRGKYAAPGTYQRCELRAPPEFRPGGTAYGHGYRTASGEAGACVLDKAYRLLDFLSAAESAQCAKQLPEEALAGGPCDPRQGDTLRGELLECCDGAEHLVSPHASAVCRSALAPAASVLAPDSDGARGGRPARLAHTQTALEQVGLESILHGEAAEAREEAHEGKDGVPEAARLRWARRARQWKYERAVAARQLMPVFAALLATATQFYQAGAQVVAHSRQKGGDLTHTARQLLRACDRTARLRARDCSKLASVHAFLERTDCLEADGCESSEQRQRLYGGGRWLSAAPSPRPTPPPTPSNVPHVATDPPTPPPPPRKQCPAGRFFIGARPAPVLALPTTDDDDDARRATRAEAQQQQQRLMASGAGLVRVLPVCNVCPPAQYRLSSASDSACTACEPGRFGRKPVARSLRCHACAPGRYASTAGLAICTQCNPGTFAPRRGLAACAVCPDGRFQRFAGGARCEDCPTGKYRLGSTTDFEGAQQCVACVDGLPPGKDAYLGPEMCRARHRAGMTREDYDRTRQVQPPPPSSSSSSSSRKITLSSFPHSLAQPGHNKPPGGSRSSGSGGGGPPPLPPLPVTHARLVGNADYEWHQAVLGEYGLHGPVRR